MCITSETCRAKSVIKKLALNNLHQAGRSKTIYDDAWKHKNQSSLPNSHFGNCGGKFDTGNVLPVFPVSIHSTYFTYCLVYP